MLSFALVRRPAGRPAETVASSCYFYDRRPLTVMTRAGAGGRLVTVLIITIITVSQWAFLDKSMTNRQQPSPVVKDVLFFVG